MRVKEQQEQEKEKEQHIQATTSEVFFLLLKLVFFFFQHFNKDDLDRKHQRNEKPSAQVRPKAQRDKINHPSKTHNETISDSFCSCQSIQKWYFAREGIFMEHGHAKNYTSHR